MSYDTKKDTITVNDVTYDVEREPDRGSPEETLTLRDFSVERDEFFNPFPGLEATLGMEEYIEDFHNPRDWCNVGLMACSHPNYNLGDKEVDAKDLLDNEVECDRCNGMGERAIRKGMTDETWSVTCAKCDGGYMTLSIVEYVQKEHGARVIIPLFLYDHSGISMSAGEAIIARTETDADFSRSNRHPFDAQGWDVSSVGVIFDTPEGVKQCIGDDATVDQIKAALLSEVGVYSSYLEGDVAFYAVQDDETGFQDACGGFVGDHEGCEAECFSAMESAIVKRLAEIKEKAEWAARDTITK